MRSLFRWMDMCEPAIACQPLAFQQARPGDGRRSGQWILGRRRGDYGEHGVAGIFVESVTQISRRRSWVVGGGAGAMVWGNFFGGGIQSLMPMVAMREIGRGSSTRIDGGNIQAGAAESDASGSGERVAKVDERSQADSRSPVMKRALGMSRFPGGVNGENQPGDEQFGLGGQRRAGSFSSSR